MRRVTLYDVGLDEKDAEYLKRFVSTGPSGYMTKREQQEQMNELRKQKKEYEQRNKTFIADEIKRAWLN